MLLTQGSPANHVIHATRSANYNMHAHVKFPHVLSHIGATNTCMALGTHEVAQSNNHLLNLSTKKKKSQSYRREIMTYVETQEKGISIVSTDLQQQ